MKKYLKGMFIFCVTVLLCVGIGGKAQAARLNKSSLVLYTGQSYQLKVIGGTAKLFKSTGSPIASVNTYNGKVAAKKPGKCVIKAKVGAKTLNCRVTVKQTVELSKHFGSYAKFKKAVGYMRQATAKEEPGVYTGTLYFGRGADASNGNFFIRTDKPGGKVRVLQNITKKQFYLYGVRIGDSSSKSRSTLVKKGFKLKKTNRYPDKVTYIYQRGSSQVTLCISKNKVAWYQWNRLV